MADGSRRVLKFIEEVTFGTTPTTPTMVEIRNTGGAGIKYDRSLIQSQEMRSDRAVADVTQGNKKPALDVPIEMSAESFDDFMEGALAGSWTPVITETVTTATVDATLHTVSVTGATFVTDGYSIGDKVVLFGFTDSGNNGIFTLTAIAEALMTFANETSFVDVTDDTPISVVSYNATLQCGVTLPSYSIEEGFEDITSFTMMKGAKVGTFALDIKPDAIITGAFGFLGKSVASPTATTGATATTDSNTNDVFNAFTGSIKEGGSAIAIVTGLTIALTNNLTPEFVVLQDEASGIGAGRVGVSGELTVYFPDDTLLKKYINGTETSIEFTIGDVAGNEYTFLMNKVKLTSESKNIPEGSIIQTLGYMALADDTYSTLQITRVVV